jgi:hypothetical protein
VSRERRTDIALLWTKPEIVVAEIDWVRRVVPAGNRLGRCDRRCPRPNSLLGIAPRANRDQRGKIDEQTIFGRKTTRASHNNH